jgi:hypothetical protein
MLVAENREDEEFLDRLIEVIERRRKPEVLHHIGGPDIGDESFIVFTW